MGDILHALPAVSALRAAHPGCFLGWAVEPQWRALLAAEGVSLPGTPAQPLVDLLHPVAAKHWASQPLRPSTLASMRRTRSALRAARYEAALDLQGAVRSAVIAGWARPGRLLGEAAPREWPARWLFRERIASTGTHVIEQAADVVRALYRDPLPLTLPLLPHDPAAVRWCDAAGVPCEPGPSILLLPGAGWGAKRWPVERYAHAAAAIARQTGCRVFINAAPGELELGAALASQLRSLAIASLLLSPTIGQLIELTRRVTLAIGGDTGPLHLAAALGKPTVGIYGPTDPARNGPFHGQFRILRDPESRRDHTRRSDPEFGLLRIAPQAVADAALDLLARAGASVSLQSLPGAAR